MSKVYIGVGHGGNDSGAVGHLIEKNVNLEMGLACKTFLEQKGVTVKISRTTDENDPLTEEIKECNDWKADLAIDIHNNSGGGDGFEAYYHYKGGTSKILAQNIEKEIIEIGQNSRGCKTKLNDKGQDYFGFIRQITCPSVICEGVFLDNAQDLEIANNSSKQQAFGIAYAKGILKTLGIKVTEKENSNDWYKVQVGAFKDKQNANNLVKILKEDGYNAIVIKA